MLALLMMVASLFRFLRLTTGPSPETDPPRPSASDTAQRFNGDQIRMAEKINLLETDNYKQRDEIRDLKRDNQDLKTKVPADGALVLTGDDASQYQALKALNLKPDEITKQLTDAKEAVTQRDALQRRDTIRQVADVSGYKASVLERLLADGDLPVVKDVQETVQGKPTTVKRAFVVKDGKDVALADHAKTEWSDFLPALGATAESAPLYGTPSRDNRRGTPPAPQTQADPLNIRL